VLNFADCEVLFAHGSFSNAGVIADETNPTEESARDGRAIRTTGNLSQNPRVTSGVLREMRGRGSTGVLGTVDT
jgi:hypothetical protein